MSLTRWTQYRQIREQKKRALHMLTLSGAVRPGTTELRYVDSSFSLPSESTPSEPLDTSETTHRANVTTPPSSKMALGNMASQLYSSTLAILTGTARQTPHPLQGNRGLA